MHLCTELFLGFSKEVLKQLKVKAAELVAYKKHSSLVIDELKLSEHLPVKIPGAVEGFVDLGPFTPAKDKSPPPDHRTVILLAPFQQ